jgi:hypothetical protein
MNKIVICIFAIVFFYNDFNSCDSKPKNHRLQAINVAYTLPIVNKDSSITEAKNSYDIFYFEDMILYRFVYRFDSSVNGETLLQEKRKYFFALHKDSLFGYTYDPNPNKRLSDGRFSADSVLKFNTFQNTKVDTLANLKPDSSFYDKGDLRVVYFHPDNKLHPEEPHPEDFDVYFYYTRKLNGVKETFTQKMDNVPGMKLFRILIIASGGYYPEYKMSFPKRGMLYEMKEIQVENREEILHYFDKYKRDIQRS